MGLRIQNNVEAFDTHRQLTMRVERIDVVLNAKAHGGHSL